jgi:phosphate starvation-inducible membrane PsiE
MKIDINKIVNKLGSDAIEIFHVVGLFIIGITIIWSAINEYLIMMQGDAGFASLKDILLLFIYLELGAMTGIYFKTHRMPVVFLIFIAITAVTRFLVIDMKELVQGGNLTLLLMVISILVLAVTAFVLKKMEHKYDDKEY